MIELRRVSKTFKLYNAPSDRIWEWLLPVRRHREFHALRDVDMLVPEGRTVGLVGANGAGKSTLLKLIAGTLLPSSGEIEVHGRVAALLELGTGFHGEFTGRQNIYVNGQLLGLAQEELARLEPEIIAFSELGPFIDQPIRTYSSGMVMRLAFAIAASVDPDVLIVDEALSVGDARFAAKCIRRIREFRDRGTTILFVSHDPAAIATLCDEAILIDGGEVRSRGGARDILEEYNALLAAKGAGNVQMRVERTASGASAGPRRHGTARALITDVMLEDMEGRTREVFLSGETLRARVQIHFLSAVPNASVGFLIKDRLGNHLFGTNTAMKQLPLPAQRVGAQCEVIAEIPVPLGYGSYSLTVAVHTDANHLDHCLEWIDNAIFFQVQVDETQDWAGMINVGARLACREVVMGREKISAALAERYPALDPLTAGETEPDPFLHGFHPPRREDTGWVRGVEAASLFVFRPTGDALRMRFVQPLDMGGVWTLSNGTGEPLRGVLSPDGKELRFRLPADSIGCTAAWHLLYSGGTWSQPPHLAQVCATPASEGN